MLHGNHCQPGMLMHFNVNVLECPEQKSLEVMVAQIVSSICALGNSDSAA